MIVPGSASPLLTTTDGGYTIAKSLRFRSSASAYLNRTFTTPTNSKIWTYSAWVKRGALTGTHTLLFGYSGNSDTQYCNIVIAGSTLQMNAYNNTILYLANDLRDPASWYHFVVACDLTQATATNRIKVYINGTQYSYTQQPSFPAQNGTLAINTAAAHNIGSRSAFSSSEFLDGYLADVNFIDGQQLTPSSFGETDSVTGVWKPKAYSGTYGTNGFYLKFTDVATTSGSNAGLGKDFSGNGNYWTTNNISVTNNTTYDSMSDVPTLTDTNTANYCVMNPLWAGSGAVITNGNLQTTKSGASSVTNTLGTIGMTSGSFYWETTWNAGSNFYFGIGKQSVGLNSLTGAIIYNQAGEIQVDGSNVGTYGTISLSDVCAVAINFSTSKIYFYKNNTLLNTGGYTFTPGSDTWFPLFGTYASSDAQAANFGQRPFAYTPPTGYKALNTYNLPDSTIVAGNTNFEVTTYTANGGVQTVTNASGLKPDFWWGKSRSVIGGNYLVDSVRGVANTLQSQSTNAEASIPNYVTAFNSNGFSLGTDNYANGTTAVAWQWKAGQGTTSSNTNGSITSTVSVNASAGFSIVKYNGNGTSGATVGHGLGVAPKLIILKILGSTYSWAVYHESVGNTKYLQLNDTIAATTDSAYWNNTSPTSSVFSLGNKLDTNAGFGTYVAYCWAEIAGFSKFGSYTGNGSTDGTFVYTGFRPKYLLIKCTSAVACNWIIIDSARSSYNVSNNLLLADTSAAELTNNTGNGADLLSNGFKLKLTDTATNGSGASYIYAAFAENPFKNALAR